MSKQTKNRWGWLTFIISLQRYKLRLHELTDCHRQAAVHRRNLTRLLNFRDSKNLNRFFTKKSELPPRPKSTHHLICVDDLPEAIRHNVGILPLHVLPEAFPFSIEGYDLPTGTTEVTIFEREK